MFKDLDEMEFLNIAAEFENKIAQQVTVQYIDNVEKRYYRSGKTSLEIVGQDSFIWTSFITFSMLEYDPFFEEFSEAIQRLIEAGVCPERLYGQIAGVKLRNQRTNEEVPALVLTMDDLGIGFVACLIPLLLGVASFIVEVTVFNLKLQARRLRDKLVAAYVITTTLKSKSALI